MPNQFSETEASKAQWRPVQVYGMATICLLVGVLIGYLFRGSESRKPPIARPQAEATAPAGMVGSQTAPPRQMPSLEQMKHMADTKAAPLLEQLKGNPKNAALLIQIADLYKSAHQFKDAAAYYERSLQIEPKNVGVRTDMASCLYYSGDPDQAIAELERSLKYDPAYAGALFNLGMVKWKGKMDAAGAVAAWEKLLKLHPELANKAGVEKLIGEAKQHPKVN
jgi:cytochrome c-type biogenesis protein CcmH/NrfG